MLFELAKVGEELNYIEYTDIEYLKNILKNEEMDIVKRIHPPNWVALNTPFLENIFATFHCILLKIPIYICGKPGCSK
jgi:hypothetical protein